MKRKCVLLMLSFIATALLSGCTITSLAQKNMEYDVADLKKRVAEIEGNVDSQLINNIKTAVEKVDTNYKQSIETSLRNQASISSDLETIRLDFRRVKGEVEDVAHKAEQYLKEDKAKIADYDLRLRDLELVVARINGRLDTLENNQRLFTTLSSSRKRPWDVSGEAAADTAPESTAVAEEAAITDTATAEETAVVEPAGDETDEAAEIPDAAAVTAAEADAAEEKKIPDEVQAEYDSAYDEFKAGRFDKSIALFKTFIKNHPDTQITDNAQYFVAECNYKKKEFDKAILEYDKMVAEYPESDKIPSALLKEGFSFLQLDYKDEAVMKLNKLVKDYPDTNQAEIARRKLKVLK